MPTIQRVLTLPATALASADFSYEVVEELIEPFGSGAVNAVNPYAKTYPPNGDVSATEGQSMIAAAVDDGAVLGYVLASLAWNGYTQVDDFAVDRKHRRSGLARGLMDEVVKWADETGHPSIRLETQTNNVPACRFYARYGFTLGGFDRHLYDALDKPKPEVALFWYLKR